MDIKHNNNENRQYRKEIEHATNIYSHGRVKENVKNGIRKWNLKKDEEKDNKDKE